jgi:hypothetical protein
VPNLRLPRATSPFPRIAHNSLALGRAGPVVRSILSSSGPSHKTNRDPSSCSSSSSSAHSAAAPLTSASCNGPTSMNNATSIPTISPVNKYVRLRGRQKGCDILDPSSRWILPSVGYPQRAPTPPAKHPGQRQERPFSRTAHRRDLLDGAVAHWAGEGLFRSRRHLLNVSHLARRGVPSPRRPDLPRCRSGSKTSGSLDSCVGRPAPSAHYGDGFAGQWDDAVFAAFP